MLFKCSFHWSADSYEALSECTLVGYADGACKGSTAEGSSSFALLAISTISGHARLLMAASRYWSVCTAIQAEMGGAAFLAKALDNVLSEGRCRPMFDTEVPELDLSGGLRQLQDTLSIIIDVTGKFE